MHKFTLRGAALPRILRMRDASCTGLPIMHKMHIACSSFSFIQFHFTCIHYWELEHVI